MAMSEPSPRPDVLIVGAGVIGCALARELAGRGAKVVVLERSRPGEGASWAAAGLLCPQADCREAGPFFDLALESRDLYPDWAGALEAETGLTVAYRRAGLLRCPLTEAEEEGLNGFLWQRRRGLSVEWLDRRELPEALSRRLGPVVRRALRFPDEAIVDSRRLTQALLASGRRRGVEFRVGVVARRFWMEAGRCRGVETEAGRLEAGSVIDAAGAWAGFDQDLPFPVPVEPARGQIVELELAGEALETVLHSETAYLVPREAGRLLVGSTMERVGFRNEVTAGAVERLITAAAELLPSAREAHFVTAWAGLRPSTPDALPILGACRVAGLFFAAGHFRNGILLAPITARLVADAVAGAPPPALHPFAVERFAAAAAG